MLEKEYFILIFDVVVFSHPRVLLECICVLAHGGQNRWDWRLKIIYTESYAVGGFINASYASDVTLVQTIYVATYGLAQILMPVSGVLMVGLSYLKIDYKQWFKYIWMFAAVMFAVLLILATIVYY